MFGKSHCPWFVRPHAHHTHILTNLASHFELVWMDERNGCFGLAWFGSIDCQFLDGSADMSIHCEYVNVCATFFLSIHYYCFVLFGWTVHIQYFVYVSECACACAWIRITHIRLYEMRGFYLILPWFFYYVKWLDICPSFRTKKEKGAVLHWDKKMLRRRRKHLGPSYVQCWNVCWKCQRNIPRCKIGWQKTKKKS